MFARKFFFAALVLLSSVAFGGGDLPFPYSQESSMPVIGSFDWTVEKTNLSVQLNVYQDLKDQNLQWIKLWIRGDDGFVWVRLRLQNKNAQVHRNVQIDSSQGRLDLDLSVPGGDTLMLDGVVYRLRRN